MSEQSFRSVVSFLAALMPGVNEAFKYKPKPKSYDTGPRPQAPPPKIFHPTQFPAPVHTETPPQSPSPRHHTTPKPQPSAQPRPSPNPRSPPNARTSPDVLVSSCPSTSQVKQGQPRCQEAQRSQRQSGRRTKNPAPYYAGIKKRRNKGLARPSATKSPRMTGSTDHKTQMNLDDSHKSSRDSPPPPRKKQVLHHKDVRAAMKANYDRMLNESRVRLEETAKEWKAMDGLHTVL